MSDASGVTEKTSDIHRQYALCAFALTGGLSLAVGSVLGIAAALKREASALQDSNHLLLFALPLFVASAALILAHFRSRVWRLALREQAGDRNQPADSAKAPPVISEIKPRTEAGLVVALTLLAALIRLPTLFHSYWYDELWTLHFMRSGPLHALTYQEGFNNHLLNSVLASLCLEARQRLTGISPLQGIPPSWLARLPACLFGVFSVPMLHLAARKQLGWLTALLAATLLAFSPAAVDFSGQTRGYSALLFFTIAQTFWLARALQNGKGQDWIGWLLCASLGTLAHLYFLLVLIVDGVFVLLLIARNILLENHAVAGCLFEQGMLMGTALAAMVWIEYVSVYSALEKMQAQLAGTEPMARAHDIVIPMLQAWGGIPAPALMQTFYTVSGLLALCGVCFLLYKARGAACFLLLMLTVPLTIIELAQPHYVYMRFFLFLLPAYLTLIACGLQQIGLWMTLCRPKSVRWQRAISTVLTAGMIGLVFPGLWRVVRYPKQDFEGAAAAIRLETGRGQAAVLVGIGSEWFAEYDLWRTPQPDSEQKLRRLIEAKKSVLLVDTDMMLHPKRKIPDHFLFLHRLEGKPVRIYRGRNSSWPYSYLDGDSDIKFYRISKKDLPPHLPAK